MYDVIRVLLGVRRGALCVYVCVCVCVRVCVRAGARRATAAAGTLEDKLHSYKVPKREALLAPHLLSFLRDQRLNSHTHK